MKYVAYFDTTDYLHEKRSYSLSSVNVVQYMSEVMQKAVGEVEIISPTRTLLDKGFFSARRTEVAPKITVIQPPTFGVSTKIGRVMSLLFTQLWLFLYLLCNTKRGEKIVVYHSMATIRAIAMLKKIKHIELVLEIREIYCDVNKSSAKVQAEEQEYLRLGDKYIFPTEILNERINLKKKPYIIATGIYKNEKKLASKFEDGKIHLVYAGTFEPEKGGVYASIQMAYFLDERYHLHILGASIPEWTECVKREAAACNAVSKATVTYDGALRGEAFLAFLQRCHIGLSTQNPLGDYNDSSFPSKILTYLCNGLEVVSVDIPAVRTSPVGAYIHYYQSGNPEEIARAVLDTPMQKSSDRQNLLDNLNEKLINDAIELLGGNYA